MHSYLRAVGFSNIKSRSELDQIFGQIMDHPTYKEVSKGEDKVTMAEISLDMADNMGISIRGEYDDKGFFHLDHYFPYFKGNHTSAREEVVINKRVDTQSYTGMCDDIRLGVSLIFFLQNAIDYMNLPVRESTSPKLVSVNLSGLSIDGKVILGLNNDTKPNNQGNTMETKRRNQLMAEARLGNQEAIDSLTIDDIDLYALISKRIKSEDVYSIVDSTFIPFGSESDNYSIIGTICEVNEVVNCMTGESLYHLIIDCNDMRFGVCINRTDLLGEPEVGRRFKGNVWMQGAIDFSF